MDKAIQDFYANHTEAEVLQIYLYGARRHLETLAKERDILKQTAPVDETHLQLNTRITNFVEKAITYYKHRLEIVLAKNK